MSDKSTDLDLIPAIKPAVDEVASYRRTTRGEAPKQSNFNGMLVFSLVLMAIMMGVGGFTLFEVQEQLSASNELLMQAKTEIQNLEEDLAVTDGRSTSSFKTMAAQQKTNVVEIDKLWRVAFRENRPTIQRLEAQLATTNEANKDLESRIASFKSNLVKVTGDFTILSDSMVEVKQNLIDDTTDMTTQVSIVRGQIQDQTDIVEGNRRNISSIENRVGELDEAISVFDRYRQQVNQRLLELQNQGEPEVAEPNG